MFIDKGNGMIRAQFLDYGWWPKYGQDYRCLGHLKGTCPAEAKAKETKKLGDQPPKDSMGISEVQPPDDHNGKLKKQVQTY